MKARRGIGAANKGHPFKAAESEERKIGNGEEEVKEFDFRSKHSNNRRQLKWPKRREIPFLRRDESCQE
jgi:hypothetical protein